MAIAPALYARQGEVKDLKDPRELNRKIFSQIPDTQSMSDLDATVAWAAQNSGNTKKLSITGFCWGGRIVWLYAAHNPERRSRCRLVRPLVPTPNSPVNAAEPTTPIDYVKDAESSGHRFLRRLGHRNSARQQSSGCRTSLRKGSSGSEIVVYPNAKTWFSCRLP